MSLQVPLLLRLLFVLEPVLQGYKLVLPVVLVLVSGNGMGAAV